MKKKRVHETYGYDGLSEKMKSLYTVEEWVAAMVDGLRRTEEEEKKLSERPPDWVEPFMTLEQAEADPYCYRELELMRQHNMTVMTRTQYFRLTYPEGIPRPWTGELEVDVPTPLRDNYLWVPRGIRRENYGSGES
jgi:hypothetical protein